jgi:hypothetical protein
MIWIRRAAVAAVLLALAGCGGSEGRWAGTVRDSAGVRIVENPSEGIWTETSRWGLEETLVIGTAEGDPDYQFGNISGIAVDASGGIYVLDQQASHVRAFDAEGQYVATFSGPGNGPGEIGQGAGPVLLGNADTLIVPDLANQRVSLFDTAGESHGSYRLSFEDGIPVRWESTPEGLVVAQVRGIALPNMPTPPDTMDAIVARSSGGAIVDTLMKVPAGKTINLSGDRRNSISSPPNPPGPWPQRWASTTASITNTASADTIPTATSRNSSPSLSSANRSPRATRTPSWNSWKTPGETPASRRKRSACSSRA